MWKILLINLLHLDIITCVTVCFGTPVLPADLSTLSPGYWVPLDLATVPTSLRMRSLCSRGLQCWVECSKWCCRYRDIKCVIISCRNDVMNPYKRSRPDRDAVLWLLTTNWTISHVCPTVCSPGTIPEALTVSLSNKAAFELLASESRCNRHRDGPSEPYQWPLHLVVES